MPIEKLDQRCSGKIFNFAKVMRWPKTRVKSKQFSSYLHKKILHKWKGFFPKLTFAKLFKLYDLSKTLLLFCWCLPWWGSNLLYRNMIALKFSAKMDKYQIIVHQMLLKVSYYCQEKLSQLALWKHDVFSANFFCSSNKMSKKKDLFINK